MSRFVAPLTPCPTCAGSTNVITGEHVKAGYRRRRHCHHCGCRFIALLEKGATEEKILLVQVVGNIPTDAPDPDDVEEIEVAEVEPGANMSIEQMRRIAYIGALNDVKWFGRLQPDTLEMAATVQRKKMRMAA